MRLREDSRVPKGLYESIAVGGPRDGIKIGSGLGWNGRVMRKRTDGVVYWYQGYYAWHPIKEQWEWHEAAIADERIKTGAVQTRTTFKVTK